MCRNLSFDQRVKLSRQANSPHPLENGVVEENAIPCAVQRDHVPVAASFLSGAEAKVMESFAPEPAVFCPFHKVPKVLSVDEYRVMCPLRNMLVELLPDGAPPRCFFTPAPPQSILAEMPAGDPLWSEEYEANPTTHIIPYA